MKDQQVTQSMVHSEGASEKRLSKSQSKKIENFDMLLKLERLNKEMFNLSKEKEKIQEKCDKALQLNEQLEIKNKDLEEKLTNCTNNFFKLEKLHTEQVQKHEIYMSEKTFFLQVSASCSGA